eukprot:5542498-Pyramimonas_sp.AAC.1
MRAGAPPAGREGQRRAHELEHGRQQEVPRPARVRADQRLVAGAQERDDGEPSAAVRPLGLGSCCRGGDRTALQPVQGRGGEQKDPRLRGGLAATRQDPAADHNSMMGAVRI